MSDVTNFIISENPELMVKVAEKQGRELFQNQLTSSQIRLVFGQVRRIEAMWRIEGQRDQARKLLILLKPRLSYQAAKESKKLGVGDLASLVTEGIDAVISGSAEGIDERFVRFVDWFEALLAYHRTQDEKSKNSGRY
jgi:CRISPR-associated protein Csm2